MRRHARQESHYLVNKSSLYRLFDKDTACQHEHLCSNLLQHVVWQLLERYVCELSA